MKMRMTQLALGLLVVTSTIVACGPAGKGTDNVKATVSRSQEEAALRALDLAWSDTANRKDVDGVVSYMADHGETLAPNEPARDTAAIKAKWTKLLGLPDLFIHWEPLRVQVAESGEIGYTSGVYGYSFTDPKGRTVTNESGMYVEVWKKVDGKWKCSSRSGPCPTI